MTSAVYIIFTKAISSPIFLPIVTKVRFADGNFTKAVVDGTQHMYVSIIEVYGRVSVTITQVQDG